MQMLVVLYAAIAVPFVWAASPEYVLTISFTRADAVLTGANDAKPLFTARVALPAHAPILPAHAEVATITRNPWWYPTKKTQRENHVPSAVPPGSPHNAMGKCKIGLRFLSGRMDPTVRIHGTNELGSIGQRVSRGCIRMRNEDILALADIIDGTRTHVRFVGEYSLSRRRTSQPAAHRLVAHAAAP